MWLSSWGFSLFLGAGIATSGSRAVQRQAKWKSERLTKVMAATLTQVLCARCDEGRRHLINVTMALDHVLHVLIIWQCCYSGFYWTSQSLSLLRAGGWVLCVAHKAATVEQNIWRWEPDVCPAHTLEVCLCTYSGLVPWTECSFVAGVGCHELCSWCASSHLALPRGILLACTEMPGVSWVMSRNDQGICLGRTFLTPAEMVM